MVLRVAECHADLTHVFQRDLYLCFFSCTRLLCKRFLASVVLGLGFLTALVCSFIYDMVQTDTNTAVALSESFSFYIHFFVSLL